MKKVYFISILSILGISCEKQAFISYKVSNMSTQEIKVIFYNTDNYDENTYNKRDSVYIDINSEKVIAVQTKGLSRVSNYKETDTYLREFLYLEVYQQNIKSKTDFSLSSEWDYTEEDKHSAMYTCVVYQSDF